MRRIRALMADALEPQERLDQVVAAIAETMVAEVCSLYVLRADGALELYATRGLNPGSVHHVQLKIGEGLVGTIAATARALNLAEARQHESFAYLPETGEEAYHSFLGVPILRAGRTLGVLVVQNKAARVYRDDESEALETVAMVLAEMIAAGGMEGLSRPGDAALDLSRPITMEGLALSGGIGIGQVILHEPRVVVTNLFNEDVETEVARLTGAVRVLRQSIEDLLSQRGVAGDGEHRAVLEAYRMFAQDRGWVRRLEEAVRNGLTAEAAAEKVQSDMRARMMHVADPYLRERMNDFDDLSNRLLRQLIGREDPHMGQGEHDAYVVVARSMGAAELLDYQRGQVRGLILEDGAATSHVVIVARALGIPVVGKASGAVSMAEANDRVIVDGDEGTVHLRPMDELTALYADRIAFRAAKAERFFALRDRPMVTADGVAIDLQMNAGLLIDLPQLEAAGAQGIGLFRTELQFMIASTMPRAQDQQRLYSAVLDAAGDRPVTFRTLDVGGDKLLPYLRQVPEENPALGYRALRLALDRPGLLRTQLRALMKASAGRELRVMFPLVTDASEIALARQLIDKETAYLERFGHERPKRVLIGAMIEVPGLLFQLDALMEQIDFASIGSNDLFQFFNAVDRGNSRVADRFDDLSVPFLRALKQILEGATRHGVPVTLCGEMAGRPLAAMALIGLGFRSISMAPPSIGPVKAALLDLKVGELERVMGAELSGSHGAGSMRPLLKAYAADSGIAH